MRGIVFDLDGTLVDSYEAITQSLNHAMRTLSLDSFPAGVVRGMVGRGLETLIERALALESPQVAVTPELIGNAVSHFRERYDRICVDRTSLLPGVKETMEELSRRGYRMSVATNKPSYFARRILDALHVSPMLQAILGPDLVAHPKPHPEMVLATLAAMQVAADEALYVGDMQIDLETAGAAGVRAVLVATGSNTREELAAAGGEVILTEFSSLLHLLPAPLAGESPRA